MKFKDAQEKIIFTWFRDGRNLTGVKVGERQVFCFNDLTLHDLHANLTIKEPDPVPETLSYKVGHDGRSFLCSPIPGGKWLARCIILLTGEIMRTEDFKKVEDTQKTGGKELSGTQVYIMWKKTEKKLAELEKLVAVVGMLLEEGLSTDTSDNDFMSTDITPIRFLSQIE
jgi:hypothetical protein